MKTDTATENITRKITTNYVSPAISVLRQDIMSNFLNLINTPKDIKKIKPEDLPKLAEEIREHIIETVSTNGGHLSSNLGVVELTIALHYVFESPVDKLIWDVGHQCYTHKLLTERRKNFPTLRKDGGISGFPRRMESPYDPFNAGHSGTSISAALAFAKARDAKKENNSVVAIIGDGSLTSGLAFEGLNNAGALNTNLVVVLNDNEMSISPNVGALSAHLSSIITGQLYNKMKKETEHLIKNIPGIGGQVAKFAHKLEEAVKGIIVPGRLFEDLGFKYVGPIEGHNLNLLIDTFSKIKVLNGPILVHVVTQKGKGYTPAEKRPNSFHGTPPFDIKTGNFAKKGGAPSYTKTFGTHLVSLAEEDDKIIAITAAMTDGTGLDRFAKRFPDRFFDVGIAEQHAVTFAAGLSIEGFKPVVAIYSTFLQRAYDQIMLDVCQMNLPVIFAMDRGGIVGEDGPTHQGLFDLSFLRSLPNIVFMSPKDENELRQMLATAFQTGGPVAIRYPRGAGVGMPPDNRNKILKIGEAEVLKGGSDCAIFAIGNRVYPSLDAADILAKDGIDVSVVNMRFIKPLDKNVIEKLARNTKCFVTVEENVLMGGFGSAILETLENLPFLPPRVKRIGIPDQFIEHGAPDLLRSRYRLDAKGIADTVRSFYKTLNLE